MTARASDEGRMHIDIAGRHVQVTRSLRAFIEERLSKLERLLVGPIEAHVVMAIEKHRHLVEIQVKSRNALLSGKKENEDLRAAITEVAERLERQARKHHDKLVGRKKREGRKVGSDGAPPPSRRAVKAPPPVVAVPSVLRSERYRLKPLSAEDAAMELEDSGEDLLVYRDARTYRVNVIYRRRDGNFGHVDPEF